MNSGATALVRASYDGDLSGIVSLIANGVDVNAASGPRG